MEIVFDGDPVETQFNEILLYYYYKQCPGMAEMVANKMLL